MTVVELTDEQLDALADRIAVRLAASPTEQKPRLLTAAQLADRLGVSDRFVYEHAEHLGAIRIGSGSKPRLRFDVDTAKAALSAAEKVQSAPIPAKRVQRRQAATPTASELLGLRTA